jgi:hypothetical protein
MKTRVSIISFFITLLVNGCSFLDYDESSHYTKEDAFSLFARQKQFLTNVYSFLPVSYGTVGGALRSAACDEAVFIDNLSTIHGLNNGTWSPLNTLDDGWQYFTAIRQANIFLEESKGRTFDDLKHNLDYELVMQQFYFYPFEARFLRSYFYFELAKRYGDIPLVTTILTEEEANSLKRTPFDQVIQFIADECDALALVLPDTYSNITETEIGRITRGMAMALKSKALLYAASPLFNPDNDKEKWERAAKAAGDMIKIAEIPVNQGGLGYSLPSLANLTNAWNRNYTQNTELILGVLRPESNSFEIQNYPIGIVGGGNTGHCPTQNLVDAYEMQASGLPVSTMAGYEAVDPEFDPDRPYDGRDPRLALTIAVNNSIWPIQYNQPLEIWQGGRSGKPVNYATPTGYYLKKYVVGSTELRPGYTATSGRHAWMLLRYSEILLNYAEAMIEAYNDYNYTTAGLPLSAKEAVNKVRIRAGVEMPPFPETLSLEEFKLKLRNERRVELAFEDQRFWDIRRWKIASQTTDIYGVEIEKMGDNTFKYTPVLVEKRIFNDKMYLYPIPQSELFINPNLVQNPGW